MLLLVTLRFIDCSFRKNFIPFWGFANCLLSPELAFRHFSSCFVWLNKLFSLEVNLWTNHFIALCLAFFFSFFFTLIAQKISIQIEISTEDVSIIAENFFWMTHEKNNQIKVQIKYLPLHCGNFWKRQTG